MEIPGPLQKNHAYEKNQSQKLLSLYPLIVLLRFTRFSTSQASDFIGCFLIKY